MAQVFRGRTERIELRATNREAALIREAADVTHTSVTDFLLVPAITRAREVLAADPRRVFELDDEQLARWNAALDAPPEPVPALVALFSDPDLAT